MNKINQKEVPNCFPKECLIICQQIFLISEIMSSSSIKIEQRVSKNAVSLAWYMV